MQKTVPVLAILGCLVMSLACDIAPSDAAIQTAIAKTAIVTPISQPIQPLLSQTSAFIPLTPPLPTPTDIPQTTATIQQEQILRMGDTIPELYAGAPQLALTFVDLMESNLAVDGPYIDGYYSFTSKPGLKFAILIVAFRNNWRSPQSTLCFSKTGMEMVTNKSYIYEIWDPPLGARSAEYSPRLATQDEIDRLAPKCSSEDLFPEDTRIERVVFEIPFDEIPAEINVFGRVVSLTTP